MWPNSLLTRESTLLILSALLCGDWGGRTRKRGSKGDWAMFQTRVLAGVVLLLVLGLAGCAGPRFVAQDPSGGVIAMPSNTDYWPTHFRAKAEEMMARKCPQGYHIEHEEEVVVGHSVTGSESTDTQTQDFPGRKNRSDVQLTTTETSHTTTSQDITEYRITFRANTAPGMSAGAGGNGLPDNPVPVTNTLSAP
jgi:hypothetical protein